MFCYRAHVKAIHVRTGARVYHVMKQVTTIVNAAKTTLVLTARTVSFFLKLFFAEPSTKKQDANRSSSFNQASVGVDLKDYFENCLDRDE